MQHPKASKCGEQLASLGHGLWGWGGGRGYCIERAATGVCFPEGMWLNHSSPASSSPALPLPSGCPIGQTQVEARDHGTLWCHLSQEGPRWRGEVWKENLQEQMENIPPRQCYSR